MEYVRRAAGNAGRATRRKRRADRRAGMLPGKIATRLPADNSHYSNEIDLQRGPFRQCGDLNRGARRLVLAEVVGVDRVQTLKVRQIGHIDRRLGYVAKL